MSKSLTSRILVPIAVLLIGLAPAGASAAESAATADLFVPIVLSSGGAGGSHYTTELTLANRGTSPATIEVKYTAAFGGGSGRFREPLEAGEQRVIPDAIAFLVARGLPLPATGDRGGTLRLTFYGLSATDAAAVTARTTTATVPPQPGGAAGLAYPGTPTQATSKSTVTIYGLRANAADRSNVAVYNPSEADVTVRVTVFAGDGSGDSSVKENALKVPPFGWAQTSGVFDGTGFSSGWVTVERTAGYGAFGAYGVVNCNGTSDGSFVTPTTADVAGSRITVPVLVETTSGFHSELVLSNRSGNEALLKLDYRESLSPAHGAGGSVALRLGPHEQLVVPDALEYLRGLGLGIGGRGLASYAGALRVSVEGAALADVFAGARTASSSPAGGQFGLFTPGVYEGQEAATEAWLYGLRADAANRTNVAVLNAGPDGADAVTLELQAYDGGEGGVARGEPEAVTLAPGAWLQKSGFLGAKGVANGWVRVRRISGSAPWIAYAVVNDGAGPGERTGDGAYVPMIATPPPSPWRLTSLTDEGKSGQTGPGLTFDPDGNPSIAYYDMLEIGFGHSKVARWDPGTSSWRVDALHPAGTQGSWHRLSMATDPGDGFPSVAWGSDSIKLSHWDGNAWRTEVVETVGEVNDGTCLVYAPDGNPSISYIAKTPTTGLRFARRTASGWVTQSVDTDPTNGGRHSLAFDAQGNPAIAYGVRVGAGSNVDTLKLARWSGSEWRSEIVETGEPSYGYGPRLAFDAQGMAAIAHGQGLGGPAPGIRFVRWDGQAWRAEKVAPDGELGGLAFDAYGAPVIAYASWVPGAVWLARRDEILGWVTELVEGSLYQASWPVLLLNPSGVPALVYVRDQKGADGVRVKSIGFAERSGP